MNDAYPPPHPDCRAPHKSPFEYDGPTHQGTEPDLTKKREEELPESIPESELHEQV